MKRSVVFVLTVIVIVVLAVLYFMKLTPQEYVTGMSKNYMEADSAWGNFEILNTEDEGRYVVVKIKYQTKSDFVPQERWFIKDYMKVNSTGNSTWEGNVYLIRKAFFWWQEIR